MALNPLFLAGPLDPDGTPQVSPEPSTLLLDDFSGTFATLWAGGGTVPTSSAGNATTNEGTTASAVSYARSNEAFLLRAATYMQFAWIVTVETTATVTNVTRWWGYGANAGTPSSTAPVTNGAVFLLDTDGALKAAVYSAGTRTVVATLTKPADGTQHRYAIYYRQSRVYWSIDGNQVAGSGSFATVAFPNLAVATGLYGIFGAANASTAPAAHTFQLSSFTAADQGANNHTISDGVIPNRQVTVKAPATAAAAADMPLVVAAHPSTPLPAGTNTIGNVVLFNAAGNALGSAGSGIAVGTTSTALAVGLSPNSPLPSGVNLIGQVVNPPQAEVTATAAAGSAVTVTLPAPATGQRHYVTSVTFDQYATAATTGSATPIVTSATNHAHVATLPTALAVGTKNRDVAMLGNVAATATATPTTFTAPATTSILWRVTVTYYVAA